MKSSEIYANVEKKYEKIRIRNIKLYESRKKEVFLKAPVISSMYSQIISDAISLSKKSLNDLEVNFKVIQNNNKNLSTQIEIALSQNGYPKNYLDQPCDCELCADTGYVNKLNTRIRCSCFFVYISKEIYSSLDFKLHKDISFAHFNSSLFHGYDENSKKTNKEYMSLNKSILETFCITKSDKNIYLFGKTGTGKTFLLQSMAKRLLENRISSIYLSSTNLFKITQEYKASIFSDKKNDPYLYKYIYSAQVLLIDDLGTESITVSKYSELLEILNQRIQTGKSTVIASNYTPIDIKKAYDERFYSRIIGKFDSIKLPGDDLRLVLKRRNNNV